MAPNPKHPGWGGRRPGAGAKPGRRKLPMPEMPGVRLFDPRPIALRARDFTHLALAGLVRTLCDPRRALPSGGERSPRNVGPRLRSCGRVQKHRELAGF